MVELTDWWKAAREILLQSPSTLTGWFEADACGSRAPLPPRLTFPGKRAESGKNTIFPALEPGWRVSDATHSSIARLDTVFGCRHLQIRCPPPAKPAFRPAKDL